MTRMASMRGLAAVAACALAAQPAAAQAQQTCVTESEVAAIAIYSVPSLVQAMRLRCGNSLSASGYIAKRGDALSGRYAALQPRVWPRAKAGMLKVIGAQSGAAQGRQMLDSLGMLP